MQGWFTQLSGNERRTFWACFAGWALDAMDVQLYAVVMPTLIAVWGLSKGQAGTLGTVALVMSAFGGWIAGIMADRIGRARVLQITILWFSCFTALSAFATSYDQLLVLRSLQGLGFGGEWAAGATLMSEVISPKLRGRAVGSVQSGWAVGYGVAALLFTIVFKLAPPETAWRIMFLIGVLPAVAVLIMRGSLKESPLFESATRHRAAPARIREIFEPPLLRTTLVASLIAMGALGGNYTILTWLPTYLSSVRHLSVLNTGGYLGVNIAGSFCGYLIFAHLSDWLGRRLTFAISAVLAAITVAIYMLGNLDGLIVLLLGFPIGFFQSGIVSGMGATFAELYPTHVRSNGQGFSYNAGRGIGAAMPALVGFASASMPLGSAIGLFAVASYTLVLVGTALLPETRGRELLSYE
ncbi:MFS transporter [Lichenihabitans psoromatis]|uniref:MFS transporter n=1 Tax=Lichenihabitans psoromatis TaxID=2528642 RepID=UPI001FE02CE1|nr:MFS transporter [Lichenihabitans psoromatis]